MFYVYLLVGSNGKKYSGYTRNLKRRIDEHLRKNVYTTKRLKDPKLYYFEAYINEEMAKERENKLKKYGSAYKGLLKRLRLI